MKSQTHPARARMHLAAALALTPVAALFGQASAPAKDEAVVLAQFVITENAVNPYQSQQALSASRVAMAVQDIPQTISVVPREFIVDSAANRMLDAAKYVTPIVENTLPYGGDRYSIRGFQVSAEFIDGTMISGADGYSMSQSTANIERLEIIKGPNAILVPGGSPGGVMNPITKSPLAKNAASLMLGASNYSGNTLDLDYNRVLTKDGRAAMRLVYSLWRVDYYVRGQYRNGYELAPSFSYQLSPLHKLTLKADFVQNRETNLGGLPLDPSVGGTQTARIARGLPRDWQFGNEIDTRHRSTERGSFELLSTLGSHVTSRLYGMANHVRRYDIGGTSAGLTNAGGGSRNPFTGLYEPGVNWNTAAFNATPGVTLVGTPVPVTDPSTWIYTRNNGKNDLEYTEAHLKNDYAIVFDTPYGKSTTLTGFSANTSKVHWVSPAAAARPPVPANNLASITYPPYDYPPIRPGLTTTPGLGLDRTGKHDDLQVFAYENVELWKNRVQLSGGVSRYFGTLARTDTTGTAINPSFPNSPAFNLTSNATSFGVVVKPIKEVSLFYSRNTTGGTMPGSLNAGVTDPNLKLAQGGQKEYGAKTSLLGGRLTGSVAYFEIAQKNTSVTNSEFFRLQSLGDFAAAALLPQFLLLDLTSKGWEFETTYSWNRNLTFVGNITSVKIRQPITNVRVRGIPDKSYAFYADYRFTEGVLKDWGFNLALDYKGDVAGENATGFTTTRALPTGPAFVPVQPSFLVAARTLVNAGVTYRRGQWSAALTILNALNKDYILAAGSRGAVTVGTPRDWKASLTYKF
ncbi:MAG: TonB-dependent receptor plug domain-containing protein [Verrucomicrobia bacterium]|nr:TonB-dependent receptor plug domain-containing protein [Verrucomicrobiota bacterium]